MLDTDAVEKSDPEDVFAVLSDDTRVAILQALWETADHQASFSELRQAVEMRDSGQFNYHLDKLVSRFVKKTDEGYTLTQAGKQINGAIERGSYTMEGTIDPIPLEQPCQTCGGRRIFDYEEEKVSVECNSCPVTYQFVVPPGVFAGYERAALPEVANRYLQTMFNHITTGFCWFCDGHTKPTVGPISERDSIDGSSVEDDAADESEEVSGQSPDDLPLVWYDCQRCGHTATSGLDFALLGHPAVAGFYYEHGIDVRDRLVWEFSEMRTDRMRIRDRDPVRASVTYEVGDDALVVVVDRNFNVVEIENQ